ncbi:MAG: GAF domain-containing sensor histidine kinase [Desmonostoc vinosum HA7617-LM4]|jgi:signal transduction histidine kinase|nr:GAF domain-containing sensor histidine kinase [Desmonostoc vinosum HA7617-LM4]
MTPINLRKLVTQKEVLIILTHLESEMGITIYIEDTQGKALFGINSNLKACKYPVKLLEEVIGWVIGDEKTASIASLVSYLAQQQYEKKTLANELLEKYQEIDLFHDISTQVTASLDVKEIARLVIEEARKLIQFSSGSILLLDDQGDRLESIWEYDQIDFREEPLKLAEIVSQILPSSEGEIVNNIWCDRRFIDIQTRVNSLICVPLTNKRQIIGAIIICSETLTTYSTKDLKMLSILASQTASAIEKAILYEQSCTAAKVAHEKAQQLQRTLHELQQTQTKLIQSEKMSSLGNLIAEVAHDINNPINYVNGNLNHAQEYTQELLYLMELYQKHYPQPVPEIQAVLDDLDLEFLVEDLPKLLSSTLSGVGRIRQLALSLRNFSRLDQVEMKLVDIHEGIDSTLLILQSRLKPNERNSGIQVIREYGNIPLIKGYANQLNQVFMNLIANAIDALEESLANYKEQKGQIRISTHILDSKWVKIQIADNGPGIHESLQKRLFEPFFTTKPIGKGTGLGLSISYQIIEKHGGLLRCLSQPGQGTTFCIQIPVMQDILTSTDTNITISN